MAKRNQKARNQVIAVLRKNGGEITTEDGKYRLPAAATLFGKGVTNNTIGHMVNDGIISKVGTPTSTRSYKLLEPYVVPSQMPVDREQTIMQRAKAVLGEDFPEAREAVDTVTTTMMQYSVDRRIAKAAEDLFGDLAKVDILTFMQWVEMTKEMM